MSYTFKCPNCQQELEAEEKWCGMEVPCPYCKKNIIIPPEPNAKPQIRLTPLTPHFQQPHFQQPQFIDNTPKNPASPSSFSYQKSGNKFYAYGDYSTLFSIINEFCVRSGLQVEKADINVGCITIKYNYEITHFVIFYQEFDKIVIEVASNALCRLQFVIDKQLKKLVEIIESSLYQYKNGQYTPSACYNAVIPQIYQKAEIDYTSEAKALTWGGPLLTLIVPFGFFIATIGGIIYLIKICSTNSKKGQEFVYISFGADLVALFFNIVIICILF